MTIEKRWGARALISERHHLPPYVRPTAIVLTEKGVRPYAKSAPGERRSTP